MTQKKAKRTQKWEYKIVASKYFWEQDEDTINKLGQEGWECVSAVCQDATVAYIFKRPMEE